MLPSSAPIPPLTVAPAAPASVATVDALNDQAARLLGEDPHSALVLAREAEALALRLDYQRGLACAYMRAARCQFVLLDRHDGVIELLQRAVAIYELLGDLSGQAEALNLVANVHACRNDGEQALAVYHRGLALRRQLGDVVGEAGSLNNIGSVLREMGQFADALKYLLMSLELAESAHDTRATAYAMSNIGGVLAELDDRARAVEYHLRALTLVRQTPDRALEGSTLTSLGRLLMRSGQLPEAMRHLERALDITRRVGHLADTGLALLGLGLAHQHEGAYDRAERLLLEALTLIRRSHRRGAEAEVLLALGRNRWLSGAASPAVDLLSQALKLAEVLRADHISGKLHELLSQIHEQQGHAAAALRHFKEFYACQQRIHGQETQRRVRGLLGRAELERAHLQVEHERKRGDELALALGLARESERQKQELLAQLSQQADMLRQLAREDGLTGLANRRWLDAQLDRERERARRYRHGLSVAMVDIDHFKSVNDRFSHRVGDEVLRRVGRLLRDTCRSGDIVGRYGGEEFVVVLVETPLTAAIAVCEKLRQRIADLDLSDLHPDLKHITVSIGVAGDAEDPVAHNLLNDADAQLYAAKQGGRNQVRSAGLSAPQSASA
ncbi:diguanylate cyclase [Ideonella sp.]|uniref:diguanylate cyclase n=1 Tax=Ideonella sp. TaxID=1929293 RepID=UPI0037C0B722